jgi:hypothetical protein
MDASYRCGRRVTGVLLLILGGAMGVGAAQAAEPTQPGTWQDHKLTLHFLGISTVYSCQGLKDVLTYLLQQVGAKINAPVVPQPCVGGYSTPEHLTQADLNFSSLQPASDEHSTGDTVPGQWRHVRLSSQSAAATIHGSDCELVKEFREEVLSRFATRDVKSTLNCIPFQESSLLWGLSFDVFAPTVNGGQGAPDRAFSAPP